MYKRYFTEINENDSKKIDFELHRLFEDLVPDSGQADTIEGEMVRAINRLLYRYFNDGDFFFRGYGKETAFPSANYLALKTPISNMIKPLLGKAKQLAPKKVPGSRYDEYIDQYTDKDMYSHYLYEVAKVIIKYVKGKKGAYTPNIEDSRF